MQFLFQHLKPVALCIFYYTNVFYSKPTFLLLFKIYVFFNLPYAEISSNCESVTLYFMISKTMS